MDAYMYECIYAYMYVGRHVYMYGHKYTYYTYICSYG